MLRLPEMLELPPKLYPIIERFNEFRYFLASGGRGSGKSNSIARFILYLAEQKFLRIVCGRETQNSIAESVYTLFCELIRKHDLNFDIQASKIIHRVTKTVINFRGFREQGAFNVQGMESIDVVWLDEAQAISKATLDVLIPTIRKENAKLFFSMNRFMRSDPVYDFLVGRKECLHIEINYNDNPFCPNVLKVEAEECKAKSEADYRHIWLGEPLDKAIDYLFNSAKLYKAATVTPYGDLFKNQKVLSIDFSAAGSDKNVASLLERRSNIHWELTEQREWNEPDTDITIGKSIALYSIWQPDLFIVDRGGMGHPLFVTISKTVKDVIGFDGSGASRQVNAANQRCDAYFCLNEFIENEWLILKNEKTRKQMETIKKKYHRNGDIYIQSKEEMRSERPPVPSPDNADSVAQAIYAIKYLLGKINTGGTNTMSDIIRRNERRQKR
jgi:phage terminase large subunit